MLCMLLARRLGIGCCSTQLSGAQVGSVCLNLGEMTNNQAEYIGLLAGVVAAKRVGVESLIILGDSQLVVRQASDSLMTYVCTRAKPSHV